MSEIENAPALRLSDADRNGTLRRLHNAVALGLIDIGEFEERSAQVSMARQPVDLEALIGDLPGPGAIATSAAEAFAVGAKAGVDVAQLVRVVSAGGVNSGIFQAMAKTLHGDYSGLKFELNNASKDLRYYVHLTESVKAPSMVGTSVHQSLVTACALGFGSELVPSLVKAQAQINQVKISEGS